MDVIGAAKLTIVAIPLGKNEHALVEDDGQRPRSVLSVAGGRRIPEEMEDERVNTLPRCQMSY